MKVRFLQGANQIDRAQGLLQELAAGSGQREAIDDIRYFLEKPGLLKRVPVLALVYGERPGMTPAHTEESLEGAVLLFRYRVAGLPVGVYTSNDRSGRRTVIAPAASRLGVVRAVVDSLERRGAHAIMLSLRSHSDCDTPQQTRFEKTDRGSIIVRQRTMPDYLALQSTYNDTLAGIGKRTRTHMRYYRKRAEELLGCTFDPHLQIDTSALLELNRYCTHPLRPSVAAWRLKALGCFEDPILVGLRDKQGDLLGVIGGRRLGDQSEVFWQMNRGQYRAHSLSLVLRSYLIEHEISRGVRRLYLDGGSSHSLCNSFEKSIVTDMAVLRRSVLTYLLRKSARLLIPWDNELAHLLVETSGQVAADDQVLSVQNAAEEAA